MYKQEIAINKTPAQIKEHLQERLKSTLLLLTGFYIMNYILFILIAFRIFLFFTNKTLN